MQNSIVGQQEGSLREHMERHASGQPASPELFRELLSYQLAKIDDTLGRGGAPRRNRNLQADVGGQRAIHWRGAVGQADIGQPGQHGRHPARDFLQDGRALEIHRPAQALQGQQGGAASVGELAKHDQHGVSLQQGGPPRLELRKLARRGSS